MENVVLTIHLLLALALIGVVLMQRSEGGGLGMGGGGGGGVMSGRSAATALGKVTWVLAAAFILTSIGLTVIAAQKSAGTSVLDRLGTKTPATQSAPAKDAPAQPADNATDQGPALNGKTGDALLPPKSDSSEPLVPKAN